MQDKWEAKHHKNTGRLVKLCLNNVRIVNVFTDKDELKTLSLDIELNPAHYALFYPDASSKCTESLSKETKNNLHSLIFIDTTWKKSTRLLKTYEWLSKPIKLSLNVDHPSKFIIRKTTKNRGLSTIEAVHAGIKQLKNEDHDQLFEALTALQKNWLAHQP